MTHRYLEWGPASHDPDNPRSHENIRATVQESLDRRDTTAERPEDN